MIKNITHSLVFLFLFTGIFSYSQSITGKISDKEGNPISYAEITISKDNKLSEVSISDENGNFNLKVSENGNYQIAILKDGNNVFDKTISIKGDVVENIQIFRKNEELIQEVVISGKKKLIERKVDRLVFNIENSVGSSGLNGIEALSMVPLINVQDENTIQIVGKGEVSLMIDGKFLPLQGEDVINYIKSLRSDNISKIEIITSPSSKYDAQGNAGIINIILKRNTTEGWSAILNNVYTQRKYSSNSSNATINYKYRSFTTSAILGYSYDKAKPFENFNIKDSNEKLSLLQRNERLDTKNDYSLSLNSSYKINNNSTFRLTYDYRPRKIKYDINSNTEYYSVIGGLDSLLLTDVTRKRDFDSHVANVNYELNFGKGDSMKKFDVAFNFLNNKQDENNYFETIGNQNNFINSLNHIKYKILSLQSNIEIPLKTWTIETGIKYSNISNNLYQSYYSSATIGQFSNEKFEYQEDIYAIYLNTNKIINEVLEINAGLRYESSQADLLLNNRIRKVSNNLFPSISISYNTKEKSTYSINYTKRIKRPDFQSLNPYTVYTNSNSYSYGNPYLDPSIIHNIELSFTKGNFTVNGYFQHEENGYSSIFGLDSKGNNYITFENFYNKNNWGLYSTYYKDLTTWWQTQLSTNLFYQKSESFNPNYINQKGLSFYYNIQNNFFLNKSKTYRLNLGFWHRLPREDANVHWNGSSNLSTTFNCSFLDKKLQLNIGVYDILRTNKSLGKMYNYNYIRKFDNYYDFRKVSVGLTYNIGKKNVKTNNNNNSQFEENQRAN